MNSKNILILIMVCFVAFYIQNIVKSGLKIDKLRTEQGMKLIEKNKLIEKIEEYNQKIEMINDSYSREEIARNEIHMVLPGEKIYRLIEEK